MGSTEKALVGFELMGSTQKALVGFELMTFVHKHTTSNTRSPKGVIFFSLFLLFVDQHFQILKSKLANNTLFRHLMNKQKDVVP